MSTLRTYNIQSIDSGSVNVQLSPNAGAIFTGLTTAQSGLHVTDGSVGIGTDNPTEKLDVRGHLKIDNGPVLENHGSGDGLRVTTPTGYCSIGANNTSFAHFYTDRGKFYFNKRIVVDEGILSAYNEDLHLATDASGTDIRLTILNSNGNIGIGTDNPTSAKLHIRQDDGLLARFQINTQTSSGRISCIGGTASYAGINFGDKDSVSDGKIRYYNDENSDAYQSMLFYTNTSERLRIGSAGQIGLGGANYGTARQVLKSNGSDAAPTWSDLYSRYFYGEQDTAQGSWPNATYKKLQNLGNYAINIGPTSIATWDESGGNLTIGADGAGYWFLSMGGGIDDIQSGDFVQIVIGKNGGTTSIGTRVSSYSRAYPSAANQITDARVSCITNLSAGDVVRFYLYHQEGTADEATEPNRCFVMGYKI